jgi:hypothetical protein
LNEAAREVEVGVALTVAAASKADPINQAGHQTHQITTGVHRPDTFHPKAISRSISLTLLFQRKVATNGTATGPRALRSVAMLWEVEEEKESGRHKLRGAL